jgi:aldehyde:ferredoxin oxidoreductase
MPELISRREGAGAELALGARALAAKYGVPELAMEAKNLELPGYDPRGAFGMSLAYATADRGGCHMRSYPVADQILEGTRPADSLEGIPAQVIGGRVSDGFIGQNFSSVKFSGIWCDFWAVDPNQLSQMMRLVWDKEWSEDDVMRLGERIWNLGRLFNLREGIETDTVPGKLIETSGAFAEGPSTGKAIGRETFKQSLLEYYRLRGWDDNGVPTEARLAEVGVDVRL